MKISRSFELHNMEPSYQQVLNHKSPKHPKSPISNKLTLTSELKIKQQMPRSPKTTNNFHIKSNTRLYGSEQLEIMKQTIEKEPQSVFNTFMEKKQNKNRSTTNVIKTPQNNKQQYMNKIYQLRKKVYEKTQLNLRSKSKEKRQSKQVSKPKSKSQCKHNKSPMNKPKKPSISQDKNKSLSFGKTKLKSKPKSKSKTKQKSKTKLKSKEQDYILMSDQIIRIKNPQQIDQLLTDDKALNSTNYSKFKQRSKKFKINQLQRYIYGSLQAKVYDEFIIQYNPVQTAMFMVHDLPNTEQINIYNKLQQQITQEQQNLHLEWKIEDIYRGAIQIVEHKYETAKFVVQAMNDKREQGDKLQKLNQWKSSKFRQILIAKNFISFNNRQIVPFKDLNEDQYLNRINNELRLEIDNMNIQKDKGDSSRNYNHKEVPTDTIEPTLSGIDNNQFELIKRARQIKQAVKQSINCRINVQLGKLFKQLDPTQISTSLDSINQYLNKLSNFVLQNYSDQYLINIRKCYGLHILTKLKNIRQGIFNFQSEGCQEILTNEVFVKFEQEIIGVGEDQYERQRKYYEHIHNKCIFDLLNSQLSTFKPFYKNGMPLPWKSNSEFISSFLITEQNMKDVIDNCIYNILTQAEHLCGVILPGEFLLECLPKNMSPAENLLLDNTCSEVLQGIVGEKTMKIIHQQIKANAKDYTQQLIETKLILDICGDVEKYLLAELSEELNAI